MDRPRRVPPGVWGSKPVNPPDFQFKNMSSWPRGKENRPPTPGSQEVGAKSAPIMVIRGRGPFGDMAESQGFMLKPSQESVSRSSWSSQQSWTRDNVVPSTPAPTPKQILSLDGDHTRILTGTVAKTKEWLRTPLPFGAIHIVFGQLFCHMQTVPLTHTRDTRRSKRPKIADREGAYKRSLVLQDETDPVQRLRCVFYNIDRDLPILPAGTHVRVVGKPQGDGGLQVLAYQPMAMCSSISRLIFFSQRGIMLGHSQAKIKRDSQRVQEGRSLRFPGTSNSSLISQ